MSKIARIGPRKPVKWYLLEWREAKELTQETLANRMGTTKSQISKLENSKQRLNDDWLAKYAHALDIEPGDLLRDPARPTAEDLLRAIDPSERGRALSILETFAKKAS